MAFNWCMQPMLPNNNNKQKLKKKIFIHLKKNEPNGSSAGLIQVIACFRCPCGFLSLLHLAKSHQISQRFAEVRECVEQQTP